LTGLVAVLGFLTSLQMILTLYRREMLPPLKLFDHRILGKQKKTLRMRLL
jgi:hypothetical protein